MACHDSLIRKLVGDDPDGERRLLITRRSLLGRTVAGLGTLALASLLDPALLTPASAANNSGLLAGPSAGGRWQGVVHPLHYPPKIRRVIQLYMAGGPSHLE